MIMIMIFARGADKFILNCNGVSESGKSMTEKGWATETQPDSVYGSERFW